MNIEIDQSGRVEVTSHNTVIAFSNGKRKGILLKSKDKREIQELFRKIGKGRLFVIRVFSALIFLLLRKEKIGEILIDLEYPGWETEIKSDILQYFRKVKINFNPDKIRFVKIRRESEAHWHSNKIFNKKRKPEMTVSAKEVLRVIFK